jgi:hypothetical protein
MTLWAIGSGVIAITLVAALMYWTTTRTKASGDGRVAAPTTSPGRDVAPTLTPSASGTTGAIDSLLESMAASRKELARAMTTAVECEGLDDAIPMLERVTKEREQQLVQARQLDETGLAEGAELKESLLSLLSASLEADRAYLEWAEEQRDCSGTTPPSDALETGNRISADEASPAKQSFLELWAPIATTAGWPARTEDEI